VTLNFSQKSTDHPIEPAFHVQLPPAELAEKLTAAMDNLVWSRFRQSVTTLIYKETIETELRKAIHATWMTWDKALEQDDELRCTFMKALLSTREEWSRNEFNRAFRVGERTLELMARATLCGLAIATAVGSAGAEQSPNCSQAPHNLSLAKSPAHLIALSTASHPQTKKPALLATLAHALLQGQANITIFGNVQASAHDVFSYAMQSARPFTSAGDTIQNIKDAGPPFPVLTDDLGLRAALGQGLTALRARLQALVQSMQNARLSDVAAALGDTHV
jgi:hypothetical protein